MEDQEEDGHSYTTMESVDFHSIPYQPESAGEAEDSDEEMDEASEPGSKDEVEDARLDEIRDITSQYLQGQ